MKKVVLAVLLVFIASPALAKSTPISKKEMIGDWVCDVEKFGTQQKLQMQFLSNGDHKLTTELSLPLDIFEEKGFLSYRVVILSKWQLNKSKLTTSTGKVVEFKRLHDPKKLSKEIQEFDELVSSKTDTPQSAMTYTLSRQQDGSVQFLQNGRALFCTKQ